MAERIEEVTIVGGGTAGWLAAVYLVTLLNQRADEGGGTKVTLIESPDVPTVGVGEATVPTMCRTLRALGISEAEFMRRCNASFKLGVRFVNWDHDADGKALEYVHPFDGVGSDIFGFSPAYHFHKFAPPGDIDLGRHVSPSGTAIDNLRGPKPIGGPDYEGRINYAYHLDAGLFADMLSEIGRERGVEHVLDDVERIEQDERGFITALDLKRAGRRPVEFVLDCTGFRGMIIHQTLGVPFESGSKYLLNDRALAVQLPHRDVRKLAPCTRSTALGAGWSWRVPLFSRIGTGYVFSSQFRSDDQAMDEFLAYLGPEGKGAEPRALGMRIGRSQRAWEKNCVAIGLSSGFIEPLESTAIFIIESTVRWLALHFPDKDFNPVLANRVNRLVRELYEEIRDFIILHYRTSNRRDTDYWRVAAEETDLPDSVAESLELYRHMLPHSDQYDRGYLFSVWSYLIVLANKGWFDGIDFPAERAVSAQDWAAYTRHVDGIKRQLLDELPNHYELVAAIRGDGPAIPAQPFTGAPAAAVAPTLGVGGPVPGPRITIRPKEKLGDGNIL